MAQRVRAGKTAWRDTCNGVRAIPPIIRSHKAILLSEAGEALPGAGLSGRTQGITETVSRIKMETIETAQRTGALGRKQDFTINWFAAYTNSHHEKRVAWHLVEREMESFLPLYSARHRWKNRCEMNLELPLFPNYVFVRIDIRDRVRVLAVPGVISLVGIGRVAAPLLDFEIEAIRSGLGQRRIEPHPYLVVGDRVRIKDGPMTGMEGILTRKKNNYRVVIALDVIMQCVAVEVDADDLEPVTNYPAPGHFAPSGSKQPHQRRSS
jgi:transcription antitermination factor NusG